MRKQKRRKIMKKILALALALIMCVSMFALSSCGTVKDWKTIEENGYFTVGMTIYDPMNYYAEDGVTLTGFDTEFAQLVAAELGVEVKFQLIEWDKKYLELNGNKVDCLWNGFTSNCADDDGVQRSDKVDFSYAYLDNAQCVIVKSSDLANYTGKDSLAGKKVAYEAGSAGATFATSVVTDESKQFPVASQLDAFTELQTGKVDFIVVDVLLANEKCGTSAYPDLVKVDAIEIETEEYSIGFRKNSDFTEKVNDAILVLLNNGKLEALAEKYDVTITASLLAKKTAK